MKLRTNQLLLVLGTVLPLILLAGALVTMMVTNERESANRGATDRVWAFMTAVDAELRGSISTLEALATSENLKREDFGAFRQEALSVLASQEDWTTISVQRPDGQHMVNTAVPAGQPLPRAVNQASIEQTVQSRKYSVTGTFVGPLVKTHIIAVRVPIVVEKEVRFVLTAGIGLSKFQRLLEAQKVQKDWALGLIDQQGHFIARVPHLAPTETASPSLLAQVTQSSEGWYRGHTLEGADTFTAFVTSPLSGWRVAQAVPTMQIYATSIRAGLLLTAGCIAVLSLAFLYAYGMSRRISDPITALAASARQIGQGGGTAALPAKIAIDELAEVSNALADASSAIQERHTLLKRESALLKAADAQKNEFLAMLSHELRNPLAALTTASQILRQSKEGSDQAHFARQVVERQTRQMTRLVEDLLDVSRLVLGKELLKLEDCELNRMIERQLAVIRAADSAHRQFEFEGVEAWIRADRARIDQVLANLLDNAIKYSSAGSRIHIKTRREDDKAVIEIADEGDGIAPEVLPTIFDIFAQGPQNIARTQGGMGVGLTVVKRIVEMHRGTVTGHSEGRGKGATFTVTLPCIDAPAQSEATGAEAPTATKNRVLLIEDNDDVRNTMAAVLESLGQEVFTASDGRSGVTVAERCVPNVILVDLGLPDIEGFEVARLLRGIPALEESVVVAVTGYGQPEDVRKSLEAGFDLHLTKPLSVGQLRELLGTGSLGEPHGASQTSS